MPADDVNLPHLPEHAALSAYEELKGERPAKPSKVSVVEADAPVEGPAPLAAGTLLLVWGFEGSSRLGEVRQAAERSAWEEVAALVEAPPEVAVDEGDERHGTDSLEAVGELRVGGKTVLAGAASVPHVSDVVLSGVAAYAGGGVSPDSFTAISYVRPEGRPLEFVAILIPPALEAEERALVAAVPAELGELRFDVVRPMTTPLAVVGTAELTAAALTAAAGAVGAAAGHDAYAWAKHQAKGNDKHHGPKRTLEALKAAEPADPTLAVRELLALRREALREEDS
jgi:hypothetical protein